MHLRRYREIAGVLARHGLGFAVSLAQHVSLHRGMGAVRFRRSGTGFADTMRTELDCDREAQNRTTFINTAGRT